MRIAYLVNSGVVLHKENTTLRKAALDLAYLTEEQFNEWVDPLKMIGR